MSETLIIPYCIGTFWLSLCIVAYGRNEITLLGIIFCLAGILFWPIYLIVFLALYGDDIVLWRKDK